MRARGAGILLSLGVLVAGSSCAMPAAPRDATTTVKVSLEDFRLVVTPARVPAGWVSVSVSNRGPDTHEMIIVRTTAAEGDLALRSDGMTVDEDALASQKVDSADTVLSGTGRTLRMHLAPGRYEVFCNMAGHYRTGMHTFLVVVAP